MGTIAGMSAGVILAFLSHIAPRLGAGNFIPDTDKPKLFGKSVSRREAYLVGVLAHIILSGIFGAAFAACVEIGLFTDYGYVPMLVWVVALTLFSGLVVMPLEGHGWFGVRHDKWFIVDAFVTNVLWGILYLLLAHVWLLP